MRIYHPSGTIAMFIAAALQHPNPEGNGRHSRISTIRVDQHKNKFDQVVVYCTLAAHDLVDKACVAERDESNNPTVEFIKKCRRHDAVHYRRCYLEMLSLVPQFRDMLWARPDYGYLLLDTKEEIRNWFGGNDDHVKYVAKMWDFQTVEELFAELHKVYDSVV